MIEQKLADTSDHTRPNPDYARHDILVSISDCLSTQASVLEATGQSSQADKLRQLTDKLRQLAAPLTEVADDHLNLPIKIAKVGDRVVEFSFWEDGNPPSGEPYRRWDIGNCTGYLTNYQVLSSRVKYEGYVVWEPVPAKEIPATAPDKVRIARFISELPNQAFIADFKTLDQLYEWMNWKSECISIAKCLLAGDRYPDNPLLKSLEDGQIDKFHHDYLWLDVKLYVNLWSLISINSRIIKAAFVQQGWDFESPRHLMEKIISTDVNGEFSTILKPYYERNAKELKKLALLAHRSYKGFLAPKDRLELNKLKEKHSQPNPWLKQLIDVSRLLGEKDEFIRVQVAVHDEITKGICKLQIDAACKPHLKEHGQVSYVWKNGKKNKGFIPRNKLNKS